MQRRAGQLLPLPAQRRRQRFAAAEDPAQGMARGDVFRIQRGDKRRQHRGDKVGGGHAVAGEELLHRQRIAMGLRLGHHQLRAGDKRPPELPDRYIKAARRFLRHHIIGGERIVVLHPQQAVDDGGLPDHDPFRSPRRAGGEDDIRGMLRLRERQRRGIRRRQRLLIAQAFEAGDIAKARPLIFRGN